MKNYVYVRMHVFTDGWMGGWMHICMLELMYACICVCMSICIYVFYACMHYVCVHAFMHVCMHICNMHTHLYELTNKYTNTYSQIYSFACILIHLSPTAHSSQFTHFTYITQPANFRHIAHFSHITQLTNLPAIWAVRLTSSVSFHDFNDMLDGHLMNSSTLFPSFYWSFFMILRETQATSWWVILGASRCSYFGGKIKNVPVLNFVFWPFLYHALCHEGCPTKKENNYDFEREFNQNLSLNHPRK